MNEISSSAFRGIERTRSTYLRIIQLYELHPKLISTEQLVPVSIPGFYQDTQNTFLLSIRVPCVLGSNKFPYILQRLLITFTTK